MTPSVFLAQSVGALANPGALNAPALLPALDLHWDRAVDASGAPLSALAGDLQLHMLSPLANVLYLGAFVLTGFLLGRRWPRSQQRKAPAYTQQRALATFNRLTTDEGRRLSRLFDVLGGRSATMIHASAGGPAAQAPAAQALNGAPLQLTGQPDLLFDVLQDMLWAAGGAPTPCTGVQEVNENLAWERDPAGRWAANWPRYLVEGVPTLVAMRSPEPGSHPVGNQVHPGGYAFRFGDGWCSAVPAFGKDGYMVRLDVQFQRDCPFDANSVRREWANGMVEGLIGSTLLTGVLMFSLTGFD